LGRICLARAANGIARPVPEPAVGVARRGKDAVGPLAISEDSTDRGTHEILRRCSSMARSGVDQRTGASKKAEADLEGETRPRQVMPWARSVHGAATVTRLSKRPRPELAGLPVPNMFEVVMFFRARGDSYARIASIGFWSNANPGKALTARELKVWFEGELKRRVAKSSAAKSSVPRSASKRP